MSKRAAKIRTPAYIREKAEGLRRYLGLPAQGFVDPMKVLDLLCSKPLNKEGTFYADYEIVPDRTHFIPDGNEAYTDLDEGKIYIRERTIKELAAGRFARNAQTIYHEAGHLVLHCVDKESTWLVPDDYVFKDRLEDPDEQADLFAAEFGLPYQDVKGMTCGEIILAYRCSSSSARRRVKECSSYREE